MSNTPEIQTERLNLRRFTKNDVKAYFALTSDEKVNTFIPMFPLQTLEEAESHLYENYLNNYGNLQGFRYAICLKTDNIPIGYVKMSDDDSYDFGYALRQEYWKQGISSEAALAVVEKIKNSGIPYITATHDVNNPGSGGVMKKIGMIYRYSYEEIWQPKNFLIIFRMYQLNFDGNKERVYKKYWDKYPKHFIEENI
jgi:RimJ/RimL family protein N-acetyltransferase